jgi:hypothetical protein
MFLLLLLVCISTHSCWSNFRKQVIWCKYMVNPRRKKLHWYDFFSTPNLFIQSSKGILYFNSPVFLYEHYKLNSPPICTNFTGTYSKKFRFKIPEFTYPWSVRKFIVINKQQIAACASRTGSPVILWRQNNRVASSWNKSHCSSQHGSWHFTTSGLSVCFRKEKEMPLSYSHLNALFY